MDSGRWLWTLGFPVSFVGRVWPQVDRELSFWRGQLDAFESPHLRAQARVSLDTKGFHCQGGSVFALLYPPRSHAVIPVIVAMQTISDYLDNLCDRAGVQIPEAFDCLHDAMRDAVDLARVPRGDYYRLYPEAGDGGYLKRLVARCRLGIRVLPSYEAVQREISLLTASYIRLQVLKHGPMARREADLRAWIEPLLESYPGLWWWEYAAACGSTLGTFALLAAASRPSLEPGIMASIASTYFPWINGLHILLDYLIDQAEDEVGGDLNFVALYPSRESVLRALSRLVDRALEQCEQLDRPGFHQMVVRGLLAMYLSDPKTRDQGLDDLAAELLHRGGSAPLGAMCRGLRALGRIRSGPPLTEALGQSGQDPA